MTKRGERVTPTVPSVGHVSRPNDYGELGMSLLFANRAVQHFTPDAVELWHSRCVLEDQHVRAALGSHAGAITSVAERVQPPR